MTGQDQHAHRHYIPAMGQHRRLPFYDAFTWLAGVPKAHRHLIDVAGIAPGHSVLEIGCGTGSLVRLVKGRQPAATVTGLDPDPAALSVAERKLRRRGVDVTFDRGFAGDLPYSDASMDRVLSSLMFHHLEGDERDNALHEALRVLRPGGELHLLDFAGGAHPHRTKGQMAKLIKDNDQIPALLEQAGFAEVTRTGEVSLRIRGGRCATYRAVCG